MMRFVIGAFLFFTHLFLSDLAAAETPYTAGDFQHARKIRMRFMRSY